MTANIHGLLGFAFCDTDGITAPMLRRADYLGRHRIEVNSLDPGREGHLARVLSQ